MSKETEYEWHLDKKVTLGLILLLVLNLSGLIWNAASMTAMIYENREIIDRVEKNANTRINENRQAILAIASDQSKIAEALAELKGGMKSVEGVLVRMDARLERLDK